MVDDIRKGAILPPVVIGVVADPSFAERAGSWTPQEIIEAVSDNFQEEIAIIDGMQRTTAMLQAVDQDSAAADLPVRLEIWISSSTDSLIYRMLVLNTGQIPWNLKQQLQVVYEPLVTSIDSKVNFTRLLRKNERRWNGGEFSADALIEAYIAFGLRRSEVDTQEALADEFSRLDMAEALTEKKYDNYFYPVVQMMVNFDVALSRHNQVSETERNSPISPSREYSRGRNVFDSQPARIGFVVSHAVALLGRVGMDREEAQSIERLRSLEVTCKAAIAHIDKMSGEELEVYLSLDVLAERLGRRPTSAVGRWERSFFETAFKVLVEARAGSAGKASLMPR